MAHRATMGQRYESQGLVRPAEITIPAEAIGWVVVGRGSHGDDWRSNAVAALHSASLATITIDLPRRTPVAAARLRTVAADLRLDLAGGLPVAYLGAGPRAAAGWVASRGGGLDGVIAWNGSPGRSWQALRHVDAPSLLLVDHDRADVPWQLLLAKAISWRLGAGAELELIGGGSPFEPELFARWYSDRVVGPAPTLLPARCRYGAPRRRLARLGAVVALAVPAAGALAVEPGAAAAALPNFATGTTLSAAHIAGDNAGFVRAEKAADRKAGKRLRAGEILGDGAVPAATGSQQLVDGDGVKYFINTNITFSTSSSASGAMSEASYTHSVSASTLNGGEVQSRLNDAYDGYETLCISSDNTFGTCQTGNANWVIYQRNGPASVEANGRQIDLPVQTSDTLGADLSISRKVFVPAPDTNDGFARWLNVITNNGDSDATINLDIANNLGSDSNTVITNDSSGNTSPNVSDTWVTTFQNYSGTTSSDPRLGHVFSSPGATVGLSAIQFQNGDDNPFWDYTITIPPGQTRIIMGYGVVQPSKADAAAKSKELANVADPNQFDFMSAAERAEVLNFAVPTTATADSYSVHANAALDQAAPGVLGNDPDASELTAVLDTGPAHAASFKLNSDGSFSYTPAPGFAGTDSFTYSSKGLGGGTSPPTKVTVNVIGTAPTITSAATAPFTVGKGGSFTIRTTGLPTPSISEAPALPAGLRFADNHDGTATISGTPAAGTQGSHAITVSAANGQGSDGKQTLTVAIAPAAAPPGNVGPPAGNLAQVIANVERSTGQILTAYGKIGHDATHIVAHVRKSPSRTRIHHLLTQAAALAKQARALDKKAKSEGATPQALRDANLARAKAAKARKLVAEARRLAAEARRHG